MKKNKQIYLDNEKKKLFVDVTDKILLKQKYYKNLKPEKIAEKFWKTTLKSKENLKIPQNAKCKISILVPVFNEKVTNIKRQVKSILDQKDINTEEYEIIYLVNNDLLPKLGDNKEKILKPNTRILKYLKSLRHKNIFVIDRSSKNNKIKNCNVGKARNILIAESSLRYFRNNKNGILVHTDGDTFFQDKLYLSKVLRIFSDIKTIGVAGGLILKTDATKNYNLGIKLRKYILYRKWKTLFNFLNSKNLDIYIDDDSFYGANMISRSFESAKIGGVIEANAEEDTRFGIDLKNYAKKYKKKVVSARGKLKVTSLFRSSSRTDASIKKYLGLINKDSEILVPDIGSKESNLTILSEKKFQDARRKLVNRKNSKEIVRYIRNNLENVVFKR